jgi:ribosomal protein S18
MIEEWIRTIKIKDFDALRNYISELNMIGLPTKIMTKCAHCNHEYELDIRYDPASFFE